MASVWRLRASSSGSASCIPLITASSPSDSGRPYLSSMRSASWTIPCVLLHGLPNTLFHDASRLADRRLGHLPQRGPEVIAPALGPEIAFDPCELFEKDRPASPDRDLPFELARAVDKLPVRRLAQGAELFDESHVLGDGVGQGLPERRLSSCLPHAYLQPLQLLAGNGIIGQRGRPVLQIEGPQSLQFAPHGDPVPGRVARDMVDQDEPPYLVRALYRSDHTIPTTAPTGTMR